MAGHGAAQDGLEVGQVRDAEDEVDGVLEGLQLVVGDHVRADEDDELIAALVGGGAVGLDENGIPLGNAVGKSLVNDDQVVGMRAQLEGYVLGKETGVDAVIEIADLVDDGALDLGLVDADQGGQIVGLEDVMAGLDFHGGKDQLSRVRAPAAGMAESTSRILSSRRLAELSSARPRRFFELSRARVTLPLRVA